MFYAEALFPHEIDAFAFHFAVEPFKDLNLLTNRFRAAEHVFLSNGANSEDEFLLRQIPRYALPLAKPEWNEVSVHLCRDPRLGTFCGLFQPPFRPESKWVGEDRRVVVEAKDLESDIGATWESIGIAIRSSERPSSRRYHSWQSRWVCHRQSETFPKNGVQIQ